MHLSKSTLLCLFGCSLIIAGCMPSRFGGNTVAPQPTRPAPVSQVASSELPPPGGFPQAPGADLAGDGSAFVVPDNAVDLTPTSVAGVWRASVGGMTCQIATPQTKFGQGYRAGPLHCPGALTSLSSWNVSGKQLVFYDGSGGQLATLYASGPNQFSGQTSTGEAVSLSR